MKLGPGLGRKYNLSTHFKNVKIELSTVNQSPLKSLTLLTKFWYTKDRSISTGDELHNMFERCKKMLKQHGKGLYYTDKIISIEDIPKDLNAPTKKVFIQYEFTLFLKAKFESAKHLTNELDPLIANFYEDVFEHRDDLTKRK